MSTKSYVLETLIPDLEKDRPLTAETFKDLIHEADEVEKAFEEKIQILNNHIDDQEEILESRANTIAIYERLITKYEKEIEALDLVIKHQKERIQSDEQGIIMRNQTIQELGDLVKNAIDQQIHEVEQLRDHSDRYDDLHRDQRDEERDFERSLEQLEDLS